MGTSKSPGTRDLSRRGVMALLAGAGLLRLPSPASAQAYPERPVRIVVPFAAGGPSDIMGRLIAGKLSETVGTQFYVDNQAGAGGNLGMGAVARATPDGLTVLLASSTYVVNPSLYKKTPYDPFKDFTPITVLGESPHVFFVHPSLPVRTVKELVDLIKANPGKYSFASAGVGTVPHLSVELLKLSYGLDLIHAPFRGAGPAVQAVLGGHIPIGCVTLPPVSELIKDGKLRGLAVTSPTRFPSAPDLPTMAEAGLPGQEATTWQALLVPAGTPKPVVDVLYGTIRTIVNGPGMRDQFVKLGFSPIVDTPDAFAERIRTEVERWRKVITEAKIEEQ
jgi:tripartite-type tricarboxylate transporter receptor subunit TctC